MERWDRNEDTWLVPVNRPASPAKVLVCLPPAGGAASLFRDWNDLFGETTQVLAVELPGHGRRVLSPPCERLTTIVDRLVEATAGWATAMPIMLFGYSFGALIAFELAHAFRRAALPSPTLLVAAACSGPLIASEQMVTMLDQQSVSDTLRRLGGTSPEIAANAGLMRLAMPGIVADMRMFNEYRASARTPLACPIGVVGGLGDPLATPATLSAWRRETTGAFYKRMVEGGHFFMTERPMQFHAVLAEFFRGSGTDPI